MKKILIRIIALTVALAVVLPGLAGLSGSPVLEALTALTGAKPAKASAASWNMSLDAVYAGASRAGTVISQGGAGRGSAQINVYRGENITLHGWVISTVGMSKLQYSFDGVNFSDVAGSCQDRPDVRAISAYASYFTNPSLNTHCGFAGTYIPGTGSGGTGVLAPGSYHVTVRAVPQNGNTAEAFDIIDIDVNLFATEYRGSELGWAVANMGSGILGSMGTDGYRVTRGVNNDPAWAFATLPAAIDPADYAFMVLGVESAAGGYLDPYEKIGASPVSFGHFELVPGSNYIKIRIAGKGAAPLTEPTFPFYGGATDVLFKDLAFCRTESDANDYIFRHTVTQHTDVDFLFLADQPYHTYGGADDGFSPVIENMAGEKFKVTGWLACSHRFEAVGYQIDDRTPVFKPEFKFEAESAVVNAGSGIAGSTGESIRYYIEFPVESGTHTVRLVARLVNHAEEYYVFNWSMRYTDNETGIQSAQISAGSDLTLQVRSLKPSGANSVKMRFTLGGVSETVDGQYNSSNNSYVFRYTGIYSQCMTDVITMELMDGDRVIQTRTYSVQAYIDALKEIPAADIGFTARQKAKLDTLLADLLTFGAEAQLYKNYRTEALADDLPWVAECRSSDAQLPESCKAVLVQGSASDRITGATLYVDNTIRLSVQVMAETADRVVFERSGSSSTVSLGSLTPSGGYYTVRSEPLSALALSDRFEISLMRGQEILSKVAYSVDSYAAQKWNSSETPDVKGFVRALCRYGRSARAYADALLGAYANTVPYTPSYTLAVDDLARQVTPGSAQSTLRAGRYVGIFYFLWIGEHGTSLHDNTAIIASNPNAITSEAAWIAAGGGARNEMHFWGKPMFGYYPSGETWVMRKHVQMLTDAGIDFLYFDTTNAHTYSHNALALMAILKEYQDAGFNVPKVVFYTHTNSGDTMMRIYNEVYKAHPEYSSLWFNWDGKPLIIGTSTDTALSAEARSFFRIKADVWPTESKKNDGVPWMEFSRLLTNSAVYGLNGRKEVANVSVAQHSSTGTFSYTAWYGANDRTRSWHNGRNETAANAYLYGYNLAEQFTWAIGKDPEMITVTGWNEWIAQRQAPENSNRPIRFIDTADVNTSRDIEPMEGGYGDNYYLQMISYIRQYKGAPGGMANCFKTIDTDKGFYQWNDVTAYYRDYVNDTVNRSNATFELKTDVTGRNDIEEMKVCEDSENVYFFVKTAAPITDPALNNFNATGWMSLFISTKLAAGNTATGWKGADYVINYERPSGGKISVGRLATGSAYSVTKCGEASYALEDEFLMVAVPKAALGISGNASIGFKWSDNNTVGDVFSFYKNGDAAPIGRAFYVYGN